MKLVGVLASECCVTDDRLQMDVCQSAGLSHSIPLDDVFENGDGLVFGQTRVGEDSATAFGKLLFACEAVEKPDVFMFAIPGADTDISIVPNTVFRTPFIGAKKLLQCVHNNDSVIIPRK